MIRDVDHESARSPGGGRGESDSTTTARKPMPPIGSLPLIESILYGERELYRTTRGERETLQYAVIAEAFAYHHTNSDTFQRYCNSHDVVPAAIRSHDDIRRIPLIPSSAFKSTYVRTGPEDRITKICFSTGTRGRLSRVPRDNTSLERFVGSIRASAEQLLNLHPDAEVFNLGPDATEAGDVWFSYVMSLLGLLRPATNYVVDSTFYPLALIEDLRALPPTTQAFLVGPPVLFLHLLRILEEEGVTLHLGATEGFVVTAGGWKGFSDEQLDHEVFVRRCQMSLGLRSQQYVRDAYNMVELNTVIFECELGVKHIPPWLCVRALDPRMLTPRMSGEIGLLAFYDPLPTSYPGFVLSDDFGSVQEDDCRCGRSGPTMLFDRRVALIEARGCALTLGQRTRVSTDVRISRSLRAGE
jgi:long-chain-fatty-acid---luciferin-component ligase